ncbi:MAG TPA: DUF192 domain-containing protein [Caulobacteraceae bacterium]|nr:DUF192 domain-containing protein [Caulobacteraceae bacterium]
MRFPSRRTLFSGVAALLVLAGCAGGGKAGADAALEPLEVVTKQGVRAFQVEIADTEEERAQGLMNRESLPRDRGMLFQFPDSGERSFWMKNTYIPLDIIYIAADGRIVSIARQTTPFSESPVPSYGAAKGVLEINGGQAAELGIEPGDQVRHPFFGTR